MATQNVPIVQPPYTDPSAKGAVSETPHPFRASVVRVNDDAGLCEISISRNSAIFDNLYSRNRVPLVGVGIGGLYDVYDTVSDNAYIETFHDRNRTPIFSWIAHTHSSALHDSALPWIDDFNSSDTLNSVCMIKKSEVKDAALHMDRVKGGIEALLEKAIKTIASWVNNGIIEQDTEADYIERAETGYKKFFNLCDDMKDELNHFFDHVPHLPSERTPEESISSSNSSTPSASENVWLKQFTSYAPIFSLAAPPDVEREGRLIQYYPHPRPTESIPLGVDSPLQLVQILKTNLAFADALYDNTYPIKIPIPVGSDLSLYSK